MLQFPRSDDRGPIEADKAGRKSEMAYQHFRDQMIAAPLKHVAPEVMARIYAAFPRSDDRGPIEAGSGG